jgi:hypothetical protein
VTIPSSLIAGESTGFLSEHGRGLHRPTGSTARLYPPSACIHWTAGGTSHTPTCTPPPPPKPALFIVRIAPPLLRRQAATCHDDHELAAEHRRIERLRHDALARRQQRRRELARSGRQRRGRRTSGFVLSERGLGSQPGRLVLGDSTSAAAGVGRDPRRGAGVRPVEHLGRGSTRPAVVRDVLVAESENARFVEWQHPPVPPRRCGFRVLVQTRRGSFCSS